MASREEIEAKALQYAMDKCPPFESEDKSLQNLNAHVRELMQTVFIDTYQQALQDMEGKWETDDDMKSAYGIGRTDRSIDEKGEPILRDFNKWLMDYKAG